MIKLLQLVVVILIASNATAEVQQEGHCSQFSFELAEAKEQNANILDFEFEQKRVFKECMRQQFSQDLVAKYQSEIKSIKLNAELVNAVQEGKKGRVKKLLKKGASPDALYIGSPLIFELIKECKTADVKMLLKAGADLNKTEKYTGYTPLIAVTAGNCRNRLDLAKLFISQGAKVNTRSAEGYTALHITTFKNDVRFARFLLKKGARLNIGDQWGRTPLLTAELYHTNKMIKFLRKKGSKRLSKKLPDGGAKECGLARKGDLALLNTKGVSKNICRTEAGYVTTPLHLAVRSGKDQLIERLLKSKVNLNALNSFNQSILHTAVLVQNESLVEKLIDKKVKLNENDLSRHSPLKYAVALNSDIAGKICVQPFFQDLSPSQKGDLLSTAVRYNQLDSLEQLADCGLNPQESNFLRMAAKMGLKKVYGYLADKYPKGVTDEFNSHLKKSDSRLDKYREGRESIRSGWRSPTGKSATKKGLFEMSFKKYSEYGAVGRDGDTSEHRKYNIKGQKYSVYVPKHYDGSKSFGLMVYIHGYRHGRPNKQYMKVLDKKNMIWVGFSAYTIDKKAYHHELALAAVSHLKTKYRIDKDRVYIAGFSWGGKLTCTLLEGYPHVFTGGIAMAGCMHDTSIGFTYPNNFSERLNEEFRLPLVLTTADEDYNREDAFQSYAYFLPTKNERLMFIQEKGKKHSILSAKNFEQSIQFLDN